MRNACHRLWKYMHEFRNVHNETTIKFTNLRSYKSHLGASKFTKVHFYEFSSRKISELKFSKITTFLTINRKLRDVMFFESIGYSRQFLTFSNFGRIWPFRTSDSPPNWPFCKFILDWYLLFWILLNGKNRIDKYMSR